MGEATLLGDDGRALLRFERHLPGPVDVVWRAVTDPEEMRTWFPTRVTIDEWKVGATLTHHFDEHDIEDLPGTVLQWDPPHRVSFTWGADTITFTLSEAPGGGTTFVLTEQLSPHHAARNAAGWDACLDRLEGAGATTTWRDRFDGYVASFESVLGPQEGIPDGVRDPDA
jgi:uncharacterized protein YndB with AHSA1/START domain